jgi:hypothetical protein
MPAHHSRLRRAATVLCEECGVFLMLGGTLIDPWIGVSFRGGGGGVSDDTGACAFAGMVTAG